MGAGAAQPSDVLGIRSGRRSVVCLVRPLLSPTDFNGYPLNLLILASALRHAGHFVHICDYDFLKEGDPSWAAGGFAKRAARHILEYGPSFVGITALCSNYVLALDLAEELKAMSTTVHVTLGGPHVSLCARETLERHPYIDTAVIGEGEVTYPELIRCLEEHADLPSIPGIAFRRGDTIVRNPPRPLLPDLNASPRPAYDLVDVSAYVAAAVGDYLEVYAGSGCPFTCTFCSTSIVWARKYRTMTPERIVDEMQTLSSYGAPAFSLVHDNLTTNKPFVARIAALIRERGLRVRWGFSSRIDTIDLDTIRTVAAAGCDYVFFGVESGSAKTQKSMRKRLKLDRILEVVEACIDHGIAPATSFILGFPDEDLEDVAATIRLAFTCRVLGARRSFINLLSAYTGTPIMEQHQAGLSFRRETANSTMVSFLEEKHYRHIEADRFIFANYYSLDYSNSPLDAGEYLDIVDFYTICLFRYRYVISYLINDLTVDPTALFRSLRPRVRSLTVQGRNNLDFVLTYDDVRLHAGAEHAEIARALLLFDQAAWLVATTESDGLIFSGPLRIGNGTFRTNLVPDGTTRHYLLKFANGEMYAHELDPGLSQLYELQGMHALRCPRSVRSDDVPPNKAEARDLTCV